MDCFNLVGPVTATQPCGSPLDIRCLESASQSQGWLSDQLHLVLLQGESYADLEEVRADILTFDRGMEELLGEIVGV